MTLASELVGVDMAAVSSMRPFRTGPVLAEPGTGQIRGPGGARKLDPKVMDVLVRLAAAGGELVTRDALMAEVWGDTIVTDFALSRCIYQLRKNLAKAGRTDDPPIETLPKRGYRLCWPVTGADEKPAAKPRRFRPLLVISGAALLVLAASIVWLAWQPSLVGSARPAIAVMPFNDLGSGSDLGHFGDGVAASLLTELGHIPDLDVIAQSSSFQFRNQQASTEDIGAKLGVGYLVEGTVRDTGHSIAVTAALVDVKTGRQVWSQEYTGTADQPFGAQQDIAANIAGYLRLSLGDRHRHGGTTNFAAYQAYAKGLGSGDPEVAAVFFDEALAHDPEFALAMAAKANTIYVRLWQGKGSEQQAWDEARPLLEHALKISDELPLAHTLMAGFQIMLNNYPAAETELRRALQINPSDDYALVHLSRLMERTGRLHEAVTLAERNARLDPLNAFRHIQLANRRWSAGDHAGGKASFERALQLDPLNYAGWHDYALRLSNLEGPLAGFRLLARLQKNPEFRAQFTGPHPELAPSGVGLVALWLGFIGDFERERAMLDLQARLGGGSGLNRELGWSLLREGDLEGARRDASLALEGAPREEIANFLAADTALRSGEGFDELLVHYGQYWPGLFRQPPDLTGIPKMVSMGAALILRRQGDEQRAVQLLRLIQGPGEAPFAETAMALAQLGDKAAALDALEAHVAKGGFLAYLPGDPYWAPLSDEPRFRAIVQAETQKNAAERAAVDAMLKSGELILPGHIGP